MQRLKKTGEGTYELSLYDGDAPTDEDFGTASARLSIAFPRMTKEFFSLLTFFVAKEGFTAERLKDAVNHVIANFQYKELNISDVVKFDRRIKLLCYAEVCDLWEKGYKEDDFEQRKINGKVFWVRKTDLAGK